MSLLLWCRLLRTAANGQSGRLCPASRVRWLRGSEGTPLTAPTRGTAPHTGACLCVDWVARHRSQQPCCLPARPPDAAVEEKGGFIWVFYGSASLPAEERPPIPWVAELGAWASKGAAYSLSLAGLPGLPSGGARTRTLSWHSPENPSHPPVLPQTTPPGAP